MEQKNAITLPSGITNNNGELHEHCKYNCIILVLETLNGQMIVTAAVYRSSGIKVVNKNNTM